MISLLFRWESEKNSFISPTSAGVYRNKGDADFQAYVIWYFWYSERKLWHEEERAIRKQLAANNPLNYTVTTLKTEQYVNKRREAQVTNQFWAETTL